MAKTMTRTYCYSNGKESLAKSFTMDTVVWLGGRRGRRHRARLGRGRWCSMSLGFGSGGRCSVRLGGARGGRHSVRDVNIRSICLFFYPLDESRMSMS